VTCARAEMAALMGSGNCDQPRISDSNRQSTSAFWGAIWGGGSSCSASWPLSEDSNPSLSATLRRFPKRRDQGKWQIRQGHHRTSQHDSALLDSNYEYDF
jgi:hypothetical protein